MSDSDSRHEGQTRVRAAQAGRPNRVAARHDRLAVLAVAAGENLGLTDEELAALRLRAYGVAAEGEVQSAFEEALLQVSARYDALVWPEAGNGLSEEEALRQITQSSSDIADRAAAEALRAVQPLIQPITVEFGV